MTHARPAQTRAVRADLENRVGTTTPTTTEKPFHAPCHWSFIDQESEGQAFRNLNDRA
jgi:hypothetical protein